MASMRLMWKVLFAQLIVLSRSTSDVPPEVHTCAHDGDDGCASSHGQVLMQKHQHVEKQLQVHKLASKSMQTPWTVDTSTYADTLTMTAVININGVPAEQGYLAAFVGGECRGVADTPMHPPFGPWAGKPMFPITVYGVQGDDLTFKFKHGIDIYDFPGYSFVPNDNKGSFVAPYQFDVSDPAPPAINWETFDYTPFEQTGSMWGIVVIGGLVMSDGILGGFVGDEMRGRNDSPMIPPFGPYKGIAMYPLMLYADVENEVMSFKYKKPDGTVTPLSFTLPFKANMNKGTVTSPLLLGE